MLIPADRRDQLATALVFFTRLPGRGADIALADTAWCFPLIGALVGVLGAIAALVARLLGLPVAAVALIALATTVLVTGALHEDGLADTADGCGGGDRIERKLEIMRDSRIGTYGVVALVLGFGLRAAALATIAANGWHLLGSLIAAHAVARGVLPMVMRSLPSAREAGVATAAGMPSAGGARAAIYWSAGFAIIGLGVGKGLVALAVAALASVAVVGIARRQIGGYTGDVLGAIEQSVEAAMLLVAAS